MAIRGLSAVLGVVVVLFFGATGVAVANTGTSNGATYTVSSTSVDPGNSWKLEVGHISGGDGAVSAAFNAASMASGKAMAAMLNRDEVIRDNATFEAKPAVSFRPTAIS